MGMRRSVYDEIISTSIDGTNSDRANIQQSFVVPSRFRETASSPVPHTINIFAAWVSDAWVWALVDFDRLVRFYVISRDEPWSSSDIQPGSSVSGKPLFKSPHL